MTPILIWGAAGHAKVVADAVRAAGRFQVVGFIDSVNPGRRGEAFYGAHVMGDAQAADQLRSEGVRHIALAFGANTEREALSVALSAKGFSLPIIVHPDATVSPTARLGDGCFVAAQAVVQSDACLGPVCIVNTGAIVEHDAEVGAAVHLSPRVCLAGAVRIGSRSWIGAGAVVRDRITIGPDTVVGAGSVVVSAVEAGVVAYGCPARTIRKRDL